jgi:putative (di)nucleoside polyphosphate hydrolase
MTHKPTENYRQNVGIVVFNREGKVLLARGPGRTWQFPQGGLDEGENPWECALRELQEEVGVTRVEYLGEIDRLLRYDFPPRILPLTRSMNPDHVGQEQRWFAVRLTGTDEDIDLNATDHPEFAEWKWATLAEAVAGIVDFKRPIYEELARQFRRFEGSTSP